MLRLKTTAVTSKELWCPRLGRFVKVELLMVGLPGLRRVEDVLTCSAFEPDVAITCDRRCLKSASPCRWAREAMHHPQCAEDEKTPPGDG